jgi:nitrite reductase/ring-hydroxylating ferredoxin subunit
MAFERVASLNDLPDDRGLLVHVGKLEIGLYRVGEKVYAMDNACPHAGYPLHEGTLAGGFIVCNGHGWEYDLETGECPGVGGPPLVRYPVRIDGTDISIDVGG